MCHGLLLSQFESCSCKILSLQRELLQTQIQIHSRKCALYRDLRLQRQKQEAASQQQNQLDFAATKFISHFLQRQNTCRGKRRKIEALKSQVAFARANLIHVLKRQKREPVFFSFFPLLFSAKLILLCNSVYRIIQGGDEAELVERRTGTPLRQVRFPGTTRVFFFFLSQSQLSAQTLLRCPYIPVCNCLH